MKIGNSVPIINIPKNEIIAEKQQALGNGRQMERIFISILVKAMEKTLPGGSFAGSTSGLAGMMFSNTLADAVADQGGLGFAESIAGYLQQDSPELPDKLQDAASGRMLYQQFHMTSGKADKNDIIRE